MMYCYNCNKEHEDVTSTLCPECQEAHKSMNWADLLRKFTSRQMKKEKVETDNPTVDAILTKSGVYGYDSLTPSELKILGDHRDRMMRNRGVL